MKLENPGQPICRVYFERGGWRMIYRKRTIKRGHRKGYIEVIYRASPRPDGWKKQVFRPDAYIEKPLPE